MQSDLFLQEPAKTPLMLGVYSAAEYLGVQGSACIRRLDPRAENFHWHFIPALSSGPASHPQYGCTFDCTARAFDDFISRGGVVEAEAAA